MFSSQVSARLETVFFNTSRREIKPPKAEANVETSNSDAKDASVEDDDDDDVNGRNDVYEDDTGNWKRRKIAKDDDDEFDFDEPVFEGICPKKLNPGIAK